MLIIFIFSKRLIININRWLHKGASSAVRIIWFLWYVTYFCYFLYLWRWSSTLESKTHDLMNKILPNVWVAKFFIFKTSWVGKYELSLNILIKNTWKTINHGKKYVTGGKKLILGIKNHKYKRNWLITGSFKLASGRSLAIKP